MAISFVGRTNGASLAAVTTYDVDVSGLGLQQDDLIIIAYGWASSSNDAMNLPSGTIDDIEGWDSDYLSGLVK